MTFEKNQPPIIAVHNLVNQFGRQVVHDHLNLVINEPQIIGIVGGSGSGKSVLMRTIIGLRQPTSGNITVMGKVIGDIANQPGLFGVLFQQGALFSALTVAENVMAPLKENQKMSARMARKLAQQKLQMVGLPAEAADKYPAELSGGMIKRASLARALALDPPILFLDEPTAGLDPIAAAEFDQLILQLQQGLQITVLIITHDLDTLFTVCDQVAVLVDKKMIVDHIENLLQSDHPWIHAYFHGARGRAVQQKPEAEKHVYGT